MSNMNQSTPNQQINSKKAITTISILLGLLVAVNIAIFGSGTVVSGKTMETTVSEKDKTLNQLQQQFDINKRALDSLQLAFPAQQQELELLKVELEEKKQHLETEIRNGKDLAQAREEIKQLREQRDNFAGKIAKLEERITVQQQQVAEYQNQNQQLTTQLAEVSQQNENEKANRKAFEEEQAREQSRRVKQKREEEERNLREARLEVSNIKVETVVLTGKNDKEHKTEKASKIERFKISFSHGTHGLIKAGAVSFLVKISNGLGVTIGESGAGVDKSTNTPFKYTTSWEVDYKGNSDNTMAIWNVPNSIELEKGTYTIEIYHNGWKVGEGTVLLKK
jgi:hypothetical protein